MYSSLPASSEKGPILVVWFNRSARKFSLLPSIRHTYVDHHQGGWQFQKWCSISVWLLLHTHHKTKKNSFFRWEHHAGLWNWSPFCDIHLMILQNFAFLFCGLMFDHYKISKIFNIDFLVFTVSIFKIISVQEQVDIFVVVV